MSVRMNLMQWTLVVLPFLAVAQPKQLISSARSGDSARSSRTIRNNAEKDSQTLESVSDATATDATGGAANTLPLFGERPKTAAQIDEEVHFLNDCDRNFTSRSEASDFFAARGWDYVADGQLDTAAHRFNLSWLLNNHNADAYWGLGVVCYQKNQLPDAIRMLKKGLDEADSNAVLMTDLATLEIKHYQEKPNGDVLKDAESHLQRAVSISPSNAVPYQKLSLISFLKADYSKAWDYFHQARSLDLSVLDLGYLNDLLAKHPDPKGVFK
ncbi:tetratricopeptide repeat protein [Spirosoma soli]|uniref:Tetratricopeptide repeat protein n=1 Tax=Spirosoma soli TaxID=1770529 RepID=A0ABW5M7T4_9BACT